jgi:hypothetical protein
MALTTAMVMSLLITVAAPEASASGNPCPNYSIQDVFDDPNGNWDGDLVRNSDELYNGLNPCLLDTQQFCAGGGNPLCLYPKAHTYVYVEYVSPCQRSVNAYPNGDYDGDGIANATEVRNWADPCSKPCPHPTNADLALNPNGDWDGDGFSNAIEVSSHRNPCSSYLANPCPHYTTYQLNAMAHHDWDNDGINNATESVRGTNPCQYNATVTHVPQQRTRLTNRLPHVSATQTTTHTHTHTHAHQRTYVQPQRPSTPACPHGYPYYHPTTRLCYANPIRQF